MKTNPAYFAGMAPKSRPVDRSKFADEINFRKRKAKHGSVKIDHRSIAEVRRSFGNLTKLS